MKNKLVSLLTVIALLFAFIPVSANAEGDIGLENAIKTAKTLFTISDDFKQFNYNINTIDDKKIWHLNWSKNESNNETINVSIDEKGTVLNYNNYKEDGSRAGKLPKISKEDAREIALDFIKRVSPLVLPQLELIDDNQNYLNQQSYYFNFIRNVNGIPFPANNINIHVNSQIGYVQNYNYNWQNDLVFPSADKVVSIETAQKAYKEKLGLRLLYNVRMDGNKRNIYPAYAGGIQFELLH